MVITNDKQLLAALTKDIKKALSVVAAKVEADMYEETGDFYTKAEPKVYQRTGALGDTPKTTAISVNGNSVSFEAYLDTAHRYTTGKHPSMSAVLDVANDHSLASTHKLRPPVGKEGFWDRAEDKIAETLDTTMKSFFP